MRAIENSIRENQNNQISKLQTPNISTQQNLVLERNQKLECCICLLQIEQQAQSVQQIVIQCNHHYHLHCLLEWINSNKIFCCICRQELKEGKIFKPQIFFVNIAFVPVSQLIRFNLLFQHMLTNNGLVPIFLQCYYDRLNPLRIYHRLYPHIRNQSFLILEKFPISPPINQNVETIANQTNQARITNQSKQSRRKKRMIKKRRLSQRLKNQKTRLFSQNRNGRNSLQLH